MFGDLVGRGCYLVSPKMVAWHANAVDSATGEFPARSMLHTGESCSMRSTRTQLAHHWRKRPSPSHQRSMQCLWWSNSQQQCPSKQEVEQDDWRAKWTACRPCRPKQEQQQHQEHHGCHGSYEEYLCSQENVQKLWGKSGPPQHVACGHDKALGSSMEVWRVLHRIYTCWGETSCAHQMGTQPTGLMDPRRDVGSSQWHWEAQVSPMAVGWWALAASLLSSRLPAVCSCHVLAFHLRLLHLQGSATTLQWFVCCDCCFHRSCTQGIAPKGRKRPLWCSHFPWGATRHLAQHVAHSRDGWYHRESS